MVIFEFPTLKIVYIVTEHLRKYILIYFLGFSSYFDSLNSSCVLHTENVILSQNYLYSIKDKSKKTKFDKSKIFCYLLCSIRTYIKTALKKHFKQKRFI